MAKQILLTISLLISNRPNTVRKCLDSLQPLLNAVPSELILTDTGCGEEVRSIIEEYTDHIIDFEWCNDFSEARNVGLKQAKGLWFLFLDDDEWFEDTTDIIQFFRSGDYKGYGYGVYYQRNYMTKDGTVYSDLPVGRIVRRDPKVKFMYSIHECFNFVPGRVKHFNAFVHHYGYAHETQGELVAHAARNISLLLVEHDKNPRNMKHTLQLAQEYNTIEEIGKSLALSQEAIALSQTGPVEMDFCLNSMYGNEVECYLMLNRKDEGIELGERYLAEVKLDMLTDAMIAGLLAEAYVQKGEFEKCYEKVCFYEKVYEEFLKKGIIHLGQVTTINSDCFEVRRRSAVFGCGVQVAVSMGRIDKALKWFHNIDIESRKIFLNDDMVGAILERIIQINTAEDAQEADEADMESADKTAGTAVKKEKARVSENVEEEMAALEEMCNALLNRDDMEGYIANVILGKCESGSKLSAFAGMKSGHWVFALARLLKGTECEKNALAVWKQVEHSLPQIKKYHAMEALVSAGGDASKVLSQIPFYIWEKVLGKNEDIEWLQQWYEQLPDSEILKRLAWESMALYRKLAKASEEGQVSEDTESIMWQYGTITVDLCEQIYRPEILEGNRDVLKAEYQVAFLVRDLKKALDDNQVSEAVEFIRQIKELMPKLAGALKPVLTELQKKTEEEAAERKAMTDEMQILGMQIKLKIRQLTQGGKIQEALAVAKQLAGLLPDDADLKALIGKLEKQCGQ